ncbi:MAG: type III secretion system chaperone [Desulfobacterales bacterium]|nr:type III secretion system chaperone [Desulfobacterales bacterium]
MSDYTITTLLQEVEKDLGMAEGALALDKNNQSLVRIDEGDTIVSMDYLPDLDRLILSAELDPLPKSAVQDFHKAMLRINFLNVLDEDTGGITFGLEPAHDLPVLIRQARPDRLRAPDLIHIIETLSDLALEMNLALKQARDFEKDIPADTGPAFPVGGAGFIRV